MSTAGIPQESHDFHPSKPFDDPRNFTVGVVRIIWAKAVGHRPEGWCLPGGLRTTDRFEAHAFAVRMNDLCNQVAV